MKGFPKFSILFKRMSRGAPQQRNITTTNVRRGGDHHHDEGGIPGTTLPFQTQIPWLLALQMGLYMGSGFAVPFLLLRHHLLKK